MSRRGREEHYRTRQVFGKRGSALREFDAVVAEAKNTRKCRRTMTQEMVDDCES